jgi:SAM-dependent methyltransferase
MKADYGIDAPTVVRNLTLGGLAALLLALFRVDIHLGPVIIVHTGWYFAAAAMLGESLWMLYYSKIGKYGHRDRMLGKISWHGDERVLDVGTRRGLLLIGAAKHLTTGRAAGIDIWQSKDLSGNARERTEENIRAEDVWDRCELHNEPAQQMSFPSESFDVVVSNQCLHNIPSEAARDKACSELVRVLKPGGQMVISDFMHSGRYAKLFREAGLTVQIDGWFPPSRIIHAVKPG